jgi:lysophospholipase L1-like esterase
MKRRRAQHAALIVAGVLLALGSAELVLRWMDYRYTPLRIETIKRYSEWRYFHSYEDRHFMYDPNLLWRPRPGTSLFNSQGYRGRELASRKSPDEIRIFAVGDSNTLGWYGERDANWPMYLEEQLRPQYPALSVQNAGVSGYSSFQGLRRFEEALPYQPDVVIFSFGANDAMRVTMSDAEYARAGPPWLALERALLHLRFGHLFRALVDRLWSTSKPGLVPRVSVDEYRANLIGAVRHAREHNVAIVLLTRPFTGASPHPSWWKNFAPQYNDVVREVSRELNVPFIDIFEDLRDRDDLFSDESHLTEEGYRRMAGVIRQRIGPLLLARVGRAAGA